MSFPFETPNGGKIQKLKKLLKNRVWDGYNFSKSDPILLKFGYVVAWDIPQAAG